MADLSEGAMHVQRRFTCNIQHWPAELKVNGGRRCDEVQGMAAGRTRLGWKQTDKVDGASILAGACTAASGGQKVAGRCAELHQPRLVGKHLVVFKFKMCLFRNSS